jgi:hypothetical protein
LTIHHDGKQIDLSGFAGQNATDPTSIIFINTFSIPVNTLSKRSISDAIASSR